MSRTRPGEGSAATSAGAQRLQGLVGVVLAAGSSARFGSENKLLARVGGEAVISRTLAAYVKALPRVLVVVPAGDSDLSPFIEQAGAAVIESIIEWPNQSDSLRRGIEALPECDGAVFGVADQPLLESRVILDLAGRFRNGGCDIVVATYEGRRGNPALFGRALFPELRSIRGDTGGRVLMERFSVCEVPIEESWMGMDVDSSDDLERAEECARRIKGKR